jgi:DNA repair protein RadC
VKNECSPGTDRKNKGVTSSVSAARLERVGTLENEVTSKAGHRERLKARFISGDEGALTDEALLELLLTYAVPQKDVQPLAKKLIATFGNLSNVLSTDIATLCEQEGIKEHSAVLLKLIDWIRKQDYSEDGKQAQIKESFTSPTLFPKDSLVATESNIPRKVRSKPQKSATPHERTGLFGKAMLHEAIDMLPQLPDTESLAEIKDYLKKHLRFSGQSTRDRNARYITHRMFPEGYADLAIRSYARTYAGKQELRDVCFYRFCKVEPLMYEVIENLLLPAIGTGQLQRSDLRNYLTHRFPDYPSTKDCALAIVDALLAGNIITADRLAMNFTYRDIKIPSFAFILYSEFPEPGMFDIGKLEQNRVFQSMLWKPDSIVPTLYELRNQGIISKVSEIDALRHFTTKYTLNQVSEVLARMVEHHHE